MATVPQAVESPLNLDQRLRDSHGRVITDLRVSITDRCNYKCVYCRTGNVGAQYAELSTADYLRLIRAFVSLGIEKVRLTGGEPLLRRDLPEIVRNLPAGAPRPAKSSTSPSPPTATCSNPSPNPSKTAGLSRVTVSMDAVDQATFERVTRVPGSYANVVRGIRAAQRPDSSASRSTASCCAASTTTRSKAFAHFARRENVIVRFIEFMPLEEDRLWTPDMVVPLREIVARITPSSRSPLAPNAASETARRYGFAGPPAWAKSASCARHPGLLRSLQPHPPHLRRQNPHLPLLQFEHDLYGLMRKGASDDDLRAIHRAYRRAKGSPPPHRRARIPQALPLHGPYRRITPDFGSDLFQNRYYGVKTHSYCFRLPGP
jgi:cyclic pyranopterin phosphate synthase